MINGIKKLIISCFCVFLWGLSLTPCTVNARWFGDMFGVEGTNVPGTEKNTEDSLIHTIRVAVNRVLWMLSFIALLLCLYAGFLMMTSGGDSKKYEKGIGILKWAGIGLAIIALSWLIISLIFWLIEGSTDTTLNWW